MNRSHLRPHVDEVRRYALAGARAELSRLLDLFPELRADVSQGDDAAGLSAAATRHNAAVKRRALKHWRKTAAPAATNGSGSVSLTTAVRQVLTSEPQNLDALENAVTAAGYLHRGDTPYRTRIAQEAYRLMKRGEARKTAKGWRLKGGAAK